MHLSAGILYFESYTNKRLHSEAFPGSKLDFLIPNTLFNGLTGSISPSLSPNTPSEPCSKAFPGSKPYFLIPYSLPNGLTGSISPSLSPNNPSEPCSKPFPGSKPNFLIPRALRSSAAGSESAFSIPSSSLKAADTSERYADRLVGVEVKVFRGSSDRAPLLGSMPNTWMQYESRQVAVGLVQEPSRAQESNPERTRPDKDILFIVQIY